MSRSPHPISSGVDHSIAPTPEGLHIPKALPSASHSLLGTPPATSGAGVRCLRWGRGAPAHAPERDRLVSASASLRRLRALCQPALARRPGFPHLSRQQCSAQSDAHAACAPLGLSERDRSKRDSNWLMGRRHERKTYTTYRPPHTGVSIHWPPHSHHLCCGLLCCFCLDLCLCRGLLRGGAAPHSLLLSPCVWRYVHLKVATVWEVAGCRRAVSDLSLCCMWPALMWSTLRK